MAEFDRGEIVYYTHAYIIHQFRIMYSRRDQTSLIFFRFDFFCAPGSNSLTNLGVFKHVFLNLSQKNLIQQYASHKHINRTSEINTENKPTHT